MYKTLCAIAVLLTFALNINAQSRAHQLSKKYIIDPAYKSEVTFPLSQVIKGANWIYGYAELQCYRLDKMRKDVVEAKLKVGYPGEYHRPYTKATFIYQVETPVPLGVLAFYTNAAAKIRINGNETSLEKTSDGGQKVILASETLVTQIELELSTDEEPPCLLIKDGPFNTSKSGWKWKAGAEKLQAPEQFAQLKDGIFPHKSQVAETKVKPIKIQAGVSDFGRELLAYVYLESGSKPVIAVGESLMEANQHVTDKSLEQTMELISLSNGKWRSKVPLAFRYLKVTAGTVKSVYAGALFHSARYHGAFACSDSLLNRIWMNSAYTLRLCMNDFLVDGIKRDRLPWAGDLAMSMMVNAYTFGDATPVKNSLTVLNRAGIKKQDINGIIDYDLWWLISERQYQLYYKDSEHLKRQWPRIKETMEILAAKCDSLGFIDVKNTKWLFIDWVKVNKNSSLQVLWWWAQQSYADLAKRVGDEHTARAWEATSGSLKKKLFQYGWNEKQGSWMDDIYQPKDPSRHANILAVVSGLSGPEDYGKIAGILLNKKVSAVGTPYMSGFEALALARTGKMEPALHSVTEIWGGMLSPPGTTTFWEAYSADEKKDEMYSFYGRPFGKSLCHAWSSGPAAVLPYIILGLHPSTDGWKNFEINPDLGKLSWVSAAVPTPQGNIVVDIADRVMTLTVPDGCTANWKKEIFKGPLTISKKL